MQILAFVCTVLPKSPNPSEGLFPQDDLSPDLLIDADKMKNARQAYFN
jgi:hypothetical protein